MATELEPKREEEDVEGKVFGRRGGYEIMSCTCSLLLLYLLLAGRGNRGHCGPADRQKHTHT